MINKASRLYHTLRYLKVIQVYYQVFYKIKYAVLKRGDFIVQDDKKKVINLNLFPHYFNEQAGTLENHCFTFLNQTKCFAGPVDWDWDGYGKLWTYHLNYFEFIHSGSMGTNKKIALIHAYIDSCNSYKTGKEPYPVSLRNYNLIKFLCINKIDDPKINSFLYSSYTLLCNRLEFHILGNHLLENLFSLYIGALFFQDNFFLKKATNLLSEQLNEQLLEDGAHFELTPSYQKLIILRLLDCVSATIHCSIDHTPLPLLKSAAAKMLGWLSAVTFRNGDIPAVNDTTTVAKIPSTSHLLEYAGKLGLPAIHVPLGASGYRMRRTSTYEIFMDFGAIASHYIPAHTHADIFSFLLYINDRPVIVDPGISTYKNNIIRHRERSSVYHNTVTINNENQSDVWSAFRVGKRAKVTDIEETGDKISGKHNGYWQKYNAIHSRAFAFRENVIFIEDDLNATDRIGQFHLHFYPGESIIITDKFVKGNGFNILFDTPLEIVKESYEYAMDYNQLTVSGKVIVNFKGRLRTTIKFG